MDPQIDADFTDWECSETSWLRLLIGEICEICGCVLIFALRPSTTSAVKNFPRTGNYARIAFATVPSVSVRRKSRPA